MTIETGTVKDAFRKKLAEICNRKDFSNNKQNVHTPTDLCYEMVAKLEENTGLAEKTFLTINLEFIETLVYDFGVDKKNIWFVTDCQQKANVTKHERYSGVNVVVTNYLSWKTNMKFDVIVGNPPYQTKSEDSNTKTQPLWDKFVAKSFSLLKDGGFLCYVHPSGWRSNGEIYEDAKILKDKQIRYLEIHGEDDGNKTFGATTRYDWYVAENNKPTSETTIKDQDGKITKTNLLNRSYISNAQLELIDSFTAKNGEEQVEIISDSSYHTQGKSDWLSQQKKGKFKYPIVYSTPMVGPTIWYSSTNNNGHFGIPKVIFNPCRPIGFVVDYTGEYGMSQFCVGIVGDKDYLDMVAKVIKNQKTNGFAEFMETCHFTDKIFNKDVISTFRKDFWKYFVDDNGNEIT